MGSSHRLGAELDLPEPGLSGRTAQDVDALGPPAGRVGEHDVDRIAAVASASGLGVGPEECGDGVGDRDRLTAERLPPRADLAEFLDETWLRLGDLADAIARAWFARAVPPMPMAVTS